MARSNTPILSVNGAASDELQVHTTKHLFRLVTRVLTKMRRSHEGRWRVLDAPSGSGALTKFLVESLQAEVTPLEIDGSKWSYDKVPLLQHDMNLALPFGKHCFDVVICLVGIKHVGNASFAIAEFSRVLKPGGVLVLTLPNDLCMQSRLRYVLDGFVDTDWIHPMDPTSENEAKFFHLNSLLSLPYLYYFLNKSGFIFESALTSRYRGWSVILSILFYPLIYIAGVIAVPANHPLRAEMRSFVWLSGRHNLVVVRKALRYESP